MEKKLRVYDKQLKKYISLKDYESMNAIEVETDGTLVLSPRYRFYMSMMICTDAYDVQLYSDIKDINGVFICEGDIVQVTRECVFEQGIVILKNGCMFIKVGETLLPLYECKANGFKLKIVGNVYEKEK